MQKNLIILFAIMILSVFTNSQASEGEAINACENKIKSIYGVDQFKHVEAEKTGHHKYEVHGKVKYQYEKHPFTCNVKRSSVRSYHYEGPTKSYDNKDDHHHSSHSGRNVAIGVGIAAIVAMAIANSNKKNDADNDSNDNNSNDVDNLSGRYSRNINKDDLEDDCHDAVDGRIKRNYHTVRRVNFKHDTVEHNGTKVKGDGRVAYYNGDHTAFSFTCKFDHHGRVIDTSYSIY